MNASKADVGKWLQKARSDLKAAKYNFDGNNFDLAAFLCQQAAEKALKAVYITKFKELKKTHDLVFLAKELGAPQKLVDYCKELSPAYIYARYPDGAEFPELGEMVVKFLAYAKDVVLWSEKNL